MALARINGRSYFIDCDNIEIEPVSNGRWKVTYDDDKSFIVVGGRTSGGGSREWFCYHPELYGDNWLPCASMVRAVKMRAQY